MTTTTLDLVGFADGEQSHPRPRMHRRIRKHREIVVRSLKRPIRLDVADHVVPAGDRPRRVGIVVGDLDPVVQALEASFQKSSA